MTIYVCNNFVVINLFSRLIKLTTLWKYSGPLGTKNRSRANCVSIYVDLYQNLQWSLTVIYKVVIYLKTASEASYDVINMATIIRNCWLIKAIVCVGMVIINQHERFF